ncbi:hypothetical protein LTR48_009454, partial [Friedmanniomyces endolithicus]
GAGRAEAYARPSRGVRSLGSCARVSRRSAQCAGKLYLPSPRLPRQQRLFEVGNGRNARGNQQAPRDHTIIHGKLERRCESNRGDPPAKAQRAAETRRTRQSEKIRGGRKAGEGGRAARESGPDGEVRAD